MLIKKKIAFIIPSLGSGGAERVLSILANYLSAYYEITIVSIYKGEPFFKLNPNINLKYCYSEPIVSANLINALINHIKLSRTVLKLIKTTNSDLIIGFMTTANVHTVIVSKLLKLPCIVSERTNPNYSLISKFMFKLRRFIYPKTDMLTIQTEAVKDYFREFISDEKLTIIKNPLSQSLIDKKDPQVKKESIILSVGRLDDHKNQAMLIRAFANLNKKNWKLFIIGDGVNMAVYKKLIKDLDLEDVVFLTGNSTNLADHYNKAKIFTLTSNFEGMPNALIEAMYFGLACISTDCPSGPSELIKHDENGYLINVNDQKMLEERLAQLIQNDSLQQRFGEKAFLKAKQHQVSIIGEEWNALIQTLIDKK